VGGTEKSLEVVKRAKKAPTGSDLPWIFAIKDFCFQVYYDLRVSFKDHTSEVWI
jgi:hypothetical protein